MTERDEHVNTNEPGNIFNRESFASGSLIIIVSVKMEFLIKLVYVFSVYKT